MVAERPSRPVERDAVYEKQRTGGVECARQQGQDQPGVPREGVRELERRDVREGPAEGQEQVAEEQPVEGEAPLEGHQEGAGSQEDGPEEPAGAGPEVVQDGADGERGDVGRHDGDGEHQVQADLHARLHLVEGGAVPRAAADVLVGTLPLEDGLEGGIPEDDACCEEGVRHRGDYLHCVAA